MLLYQKLAAVNALLGSSKRKSKNAMSAKKREQLVSYPLGNHKCCVSMRCKTSVVSSCGALGVRLISSLRKGSMYLKYEGLVRAIKDNTVMSYLAAICFLLACGLATYVTQGQAWAFWDIYQDD